MRVHLVIEGKPVPLQRHRTSKGRTYPPTRSRAFRELVQPSWMEAGRPALNDSSLALSARFYGARANADLDNLVKAVLGARGGLAFDDDHQVVCLSGCHKLPTDVDGPRTEVDLWPAVTA